MTEPFRDNETSVRELAARLAVEIHDLDHQILVARTKADAVEHPVLDAILTPIAVFLLVSGVVTGVIGAQKLELFKVVTTIERHCF